MSDLNELKYLDEAVFKAIDGSNLSQKRVDLLADYVRERNRRERILHGNAARAYVEAHDLRVHLRDRDAHTNETERLI